jgi:hypothetical protein
MPNIKPRPRANQQAFDNVWNYFIIGMRPPVTQTLEALVPGDATVAPELRAALQQAHASPDSRGIDTFAGRLRHVAARFDLTVPVER